MYKKSLLSAAIASTLLTGCLDSENLDSNNASDGSAIPEVTSTYAVFNPAISLLPVPSDVLVETDDDGNGVDGTYSASSSLAALDYLDGASPTAPINIPFSGPLSDAELDGTAFIPGTTVLPAPVNKTLLIPNPNQNVFLLDITYPGGDELSTVAVGALEEIPTLQAGVLYQTYGAAFAAAGAALTTYAGDPSGANLTALNTAVATLEAAEAALMANTNYRVELVTVDGYEGTLRIMPRQPLNKESKYLVVVTNEITDSDGDNVTASPVYDDLTNSPRSEFEGNSTYLGLYDAIDGWETLATGYFEALLNNSLDGGVTPSVREVFGKESLDASNVVLSYTFTTGGTDTIMKAMSAPETFFEKSATTTAKQDGITALFDGTINILAAADTATTPLDAFFQGLVTNPASPLYIEGIADGTYTSYTALLGAYAAGTIGSSVLYQAQTAAATAHLSVVNGDTGPGTGDGGTIAATAAGTVATINGAVPGALYIPDSGITDKETTNTPGSITVFDTFLPVGLGVINPNGGGVITDPANPAGYALPAVAFGLPNPGLIMQGQIDVPYFLPSAAGANAGNLFTGTWEANEGLGAINPSLTAPSDKVTHRFPFASQQTTETIPFLLSLPDADNNQAQDTKPAGGWPVVIYQHGILGSRAHSLPIGNQLGLGSAFGGDDFATIAIDMPLHGLTPNLVTGGLDTAAAGGLSVDVDSAANSYAARDWTGTQFEGLHERHYGYTYTAFNDPTPTPMTYDGTTYTISGPTDRADNGYSGEYFLNLALPPAIRDNLMQNSMDLMTLAASLEDIDIDGNPANQPDLDPTRVYFVGHSLGGIVGSAFSAVNNDAAIQGSANNNLPELKAVALANTGAQVTRILEHSVAFGPTVKNGLSAATNGVVVQGTSSFETFMGVAQAALAGAEPHNFAAGLAATERADTIRTPILAFEIYGDGTNTSTQDDTIPLVVDSNDGAYFAPVDPGLNSPLTGSEPLFNALGLTELVPGVNNDATGIRGVTRFNTGAHTTLITADNPAVFGEEAVQLVSFFSSNGLSVTLGGASAAVIATTGDVVTLPDFEN